jgi:hypothetical protein
MNSRHSLERIAQADRLRLRRHARLTFLPGRKSSLRRRAGLRLMDREYIQRKQRNAKTSAAGFPLV